METEVDQSVFQENGSGFNERNHLRVPPGYGANPVMVWVWLFPDYYFFYISLLHVSHFIFHFLSFFYFFPLTALSVSTTSF